MTGERGTDNFHSLCLECLGKNIFRAQAIPTVVLLIQSTNRPNAQETQVGIGLN